MIITGTDMYMTRGDTENIVITLRKGKDEVALENGDKIYFTVKEDVNVEETQIQKVITEFEDGKAVITLDPKDTKHMYFGDYVYDIQYTDRSGNVKTIIRPSKFTIGGEVTYE